MKLNKEVYAQALAEEKERIAKEKERKIVYKSIQKARRDALGWKKYWISFVEVSKQFFAGTTRALNSIDNHYQQANKKKKKNRKPQKVKIDTRESKDPFGLKDIDNMLK